MKKDPYLSELDALDDLVPEEEPTDVRLENPPSPETEPPPAEGREPLELAQDVPVQVVVVIGRKGVTIKDLTDLRPGQVIELDRVPHEAVDLVVGGRVIAKGELVEIDSKLGVRVLKIIK